MLRLRNSVQPYAWGSRTFIPELLGAPPTSEPQAELWLGAHPTAPSQLACNGEMVTLDAWIRRDPESVLGAATAARFGGELPFLLKVLAIAEPLSIQAHPSAVQARAGCARETGAGIPLDSPRRCYRDPHPKPELICALTPFRALGRFREPAEIAARIAALGVPGLEELLAALRQSPDRRGLSAFFEAWMTLEPATRSEWLQRAASAARRASRDPACAEMARLADAYPTDPGALAPLLLNLVELAPGEAMYVPAGELHAYLSGAAVEVMANSDNVLRGGLTKKHVDVPELLRTLTFESGAVEVLAPRQGRPGEAVYPAPAEEFALARIEVTPARCFAAGSGRSVEILLCTAGAGRIATGAGLDFRRGDSFLVPAAAPAYRIEGEATLYRATVG